MESKGFNKIERKNVLGKNGGLSGWQDLSDTPPEYWSDRAKKELPVKEKYEKGTPDEKIRKIAIAETTPKKPDESVQDYMDRINDIEQKMTTRNPGESDKKYDKRMKELQRELEKTVSMPSPKLDKDYAYGKVDEYGQPITRDPEDGHSLVQTTKMVNDKKREVVHGVRFMERQPRYKPEDFPGLSQKSEEEHKRELADTLETFTSDAISDMDAAKNPENPEHIMNVGELKKERKLDRGNVEDEVVDYYVGSGGVFSRYGDNDYNDDERSFVADRRAENAEKDRQNSNIIAIQKEGRKLEGLLYPAVEAGIFGEDAAYVIASERDDDGCKTDAAVVVQTDAFGPQPICLDLTVSKLSDRDEGNNKLSSIKKGLDKYHGIVHPKHLYTCLGNKLPRLEQGIPHFTLCLPWKRDGGAPEFSSLKNALVEGKPISQEVQALIDMQIFLQAAHWGRYYGQDNQEDSQDKAGLFNSLAIHFRDHFCDSLGIETGRTISAVKSMLASHPDATRFISKFMISA